MGCLKRIAGASAAEARRYTREQSGGYYYDVGVYPNPHVDSRSTERAPARLSRRARHREVRLD